VPDDGDREVSLEEVEAMLDRIVAGIPEKCQKCGGPCTLRDIEEDLF
jgi:hypothetical protein